MHDGSLIASFTRARRDPSLAVLEGLHALKHALRFGARVHTVLTRDRAQLARLARQLAGDVAARIEADAQQVDEGLFAALAPLPISTGVIALAQRPAVDVHALLSCGEGAPVILLEDPRDLRNLGACVRVAAAAGAAGLLSTGSHDPWNPEALRGAAGLHYALPVARLASADQLDTGGRALVALDPGGAPLDPSSLPARCVLAFGGERYGLSEALAERAQARVSIPMRPGVSSLNLATSVAAVLFAWRCSAHPYGPQSPP